jgi:PHD/YefM family antitoxin component YafN of YafNO toxin-antitoxin module
MNDLAKALSAAIDESATDTKTRLKLAKKVVEQEYDLICITNKPMRLILDQQYYKGV